MTPSDAGRLLRAAGDWVIEDGTKFRHGHGIFVNGAAEGNTYEGEWSNDKMHGRGTFVYASKAKYEGEFADNVYSGHGIYTFPDGAVYDGPFVESQMHGKGLFTDAQGIPWRGEFYNGTGPGLPATATVIAT